MNALLEDAKKILEIPSLSHEGTDRAVQFLFSRLEEMGIPAKTQHVYHSMEGVSKKQYNLIGIMGDPLVDRKIKQGLCLLSHIDTVEPPALQKALSAEIKEGKVFGLGAADAKLDFLCKIYAAAAFREKKLNQPIYLVATCGGEMGQFGSRYLIESHALNPLFVLVGAPTELHLGHGHKQLALYKMSVSYQITERDSKGFSRRVSLRVLGRGSHSAFLGGVNALTGLMDVLKAADEKGFKFKIVEIKGGGSTNRIPDDAFVQLYLTSHQFEDFKKFIKLQATSREGLEFQVEYGNLGDIGISFLPDNLFRSCRNIVDISQRLPGLLVGQTEEEYSPTGLTAAVTRVDQGMNRTEIYFDVRIPNRYSFVKVDEAFQALMRDVASQNPALHFELTRNRTSLGLVSPQKSAWLTTIEESYQGAEIPFQKIRSSMATEAGLFAKAGYDVAFFGPGSADSSSHSPEESVSTDSLEKAVKFYESLIERVCL